MNTEQEVSASDMHMGKDFVVEEVTEPELDRSFALSPPSFPYDYDDDQSIDSIVSEIQCTPNKYLPKITLDAKSMKALNNLPEDRRRPLVRTMRNGGNQQHVLAMQKCLPSLYSSAKPLMKYDRRIDVLKRTTSKISLKN